VRHIFAPSSLKTKILKFSKMANKKQKRKLIEEKQVETDEKPKKQVEESEEDEDYESDKVKMSFYCRQHLDMWFYLHRQQILFSPSLS
jgi:hypothetical protein